MRWSLGALAVVLGASVGCGGGGGGNPTTGSAGGDAGGSAAVAGAGAGAGGSASPTAGSGGVAGSSGGKGGGGGAAGAMDMGPPVPRIENTDGSSVLEHPQTSLNPKGLCTSGGVYCNGECLAAENAVKDNCSVLKLGLGQASSMALTDEALFYTAANTEILKLDLAKGTHSSLVRGLVFVDALVVDGDFLYFGTETPDSFFDYDARRVALGGGDVTVIAPQGNEVGSIVPLPNAILLGRGNFEFDLSSVPKAGGAATSFGGIRGATSLVLGGDTLYYRTLHGLSSTSIDAPMPDHTLNHEFADTFLILEGDYVYYAIEDAYTRTPTAGGTPEKLQDLEANSGVWGRTKTQVILATSDATDKTLMHISVMPIAGGTPTPLVTIEQGELRAVAGNDTDLYLGVGSLGTGGLLKVTLP